ncbi:ATP-binding cassette domain-containing protein, partial [Streptomyces sp. UNOC14_S4]|uniref:ABC transporter ATP-binding protein n=1 Tax=Streptomyces sp. UNOC14_S4 TaxID=2872340 RepID=UPI001E38F96C
MIQAIGLTSVPRRDRPPVVDDLTFEAGSGRVTVLLGAEGAGKTSTLRLMLRLDPGRGVALFRGRPLDRVAHPTREIGVLLGDVPGHPARTARNHLRMLSAAAGVPEERVDEVLEVVGLTGLADQRIGDFSRGMDRRLGLAAALLGDPHTLILDEPARELSPRETAWLHGLLRGFAVQGGAVLVTSRDAREATRIGHQVVTIDQGRLVADQEVAAFARTRLRPRVAVRSPSAPRLAHLLTAEADAVGASSGRPPVEVVDEGCGRLSVYGSTCAAVGEVAHRHGIPVHRLTEETGPTGSVTPLARADGRRPGPKGEVTAGDDEAAAAAESCAAPDAGDSAVRSIPAAGGTPVRDAPAAGGAVAAAGASPRAGGALVAPSEERWPERSPEGQSPEAPEGRPCEPPSSGGDGRGAVECPGSSVRPVPVPSPLPPLP